MKTRHNKKEGVSVASFLETGRIPLNMDVLSGRQGLRKRIIEAAINRPGLALSGFFKHFPFRRIQVLGWSEYAYLSSLSANEVAERLRNFFSHHIPCVVVARNKKLLPIIHALSEEHGVPVLRTKMVTKYFVNAATIIMENLMAPRRRVQGTMVEIMGIGVLIEGKAGMGKSETALALIRKGAALVSDDITDLRLDSAGALIASPVDVTHYHMEIKGLGIIHVPSLFGVASVRGEKKLDLVVTLCPPESRDSGHMERRAEQTREFFGIRIPQVNVPVAPGRDLSNVVETAALDQKLRTLGHDAAKELDEKLMSMLSGGKNASE